MKKNSAQYKNSFVLIFNAFPRIEKQISTISGGDRILIELSKNWRTKFHKYHILTCPGGSHVFNYYLENKKGMSIKSLPIHSVFYKNIGLLYAAKTLHGIIVAVSRKTLPNTLYFSSSDFFPDVLPALFGKIFHPHTRWVAAFYFFASRPFSKDFPYKGFIQTLRGIMYYLTQRVAYALILRCADYVVLCNELDKKKFVRDGFPADKISCIYGGVDLALPNSVPEKSTKIFDAIFMARFHPQKGPLEALKAWMKVASELPQARLGMIGTGPIGHEVHQFVTKHKLENNVELLGFQDGKKKYEILKSSKLFIHPAMYETGGMAAAEAMAAGLPVIAFDHPGYTYSFPKGMKYVQPVGDTDAFARSVLELLQEDKKRQKLAEEARAFARQWDWKKRADDLEEDLWKAGLLHTK